MPGTIPTEPIGSVPRPTQLIVRSAGLSGGHVSASEVRALQEAAIRDTINAYREAGEQVLVDGEQTKPSFAHYPFEGVANLDPQGGITIQFTEGEVHQRQLPRLMAGPFRYGTYADTYVKAALPYTGGMPYKQAVIAPSMVSLIYPAEDIEGYPRDQFLADVVAECTEDIRRCFAAGADSVQMDFTEGRLAQKFDPSGGLLDAFIDLNNRVLATFSAEQRRKIGIHVCPGGDRNSFHSLDQPYDALLKRLFDVNAGAFFMQLACEPDRRVALASMRDNAKPGQRLFVGVIATNSNAIETPDEVEARIREAAEFIPLEQLGTTDDCGFSPFGDDIAQSREVAFAKIRARTVGTENASRALLG